MLESLALVFLVGLLAASICRRARLPRIVGMLAAGLLLGPCALNLLSGKLLSVSGDLRQMALVVILLKAGLSLDAGELREVGRPALLLAFLPACFEIAGVVLLARPLLHVTAAEAALLGSVLAAVSPAVVVPRMVALMEAGYGTQKRIPQMLLAGASLDDVFVIVLFSTFLRVAQGGSARAADFAGIPVAIALGVAAGAGAGLLLAALFERRHARGAGVRGSVKVIVVLAAAFLLAALEDRLPVPMSGLLAVMSMACALKLCCRGRVVRQLADRFGKLWLAAEVLLFVLVGAAVDVRYTLGAGPGALLLIALALLFRAAGVLCCVAGTALRPGERLFCVLAYLPKATVQAAIGGVPLAAGLSCGNLVLSCAVIAILLTAPLGALGMDASSRRLLTRADAAPEP